MKKKKLIVEAVVLTVAPLIAFFVVGAAAGSPFIGFLASVVTVIGVSLWQGRAVIMKAWISGKAVFMKAWISGKVD